MEAEGCAAVACKADLTRLRPINLRAAAAAHAHSASAVHTIDRPQMLRTTCAYGDKSRKPDAPMLLVDTGVSAYTGSTRYCQVYIYKADGMGSRTWSPYYTVSRWEQLSYRVAARDKETVGEPAAICSWMLSLRPRCSRALRCSLLIFPQRISRCGSSTCTAFVRRVRDRSELLLSMLASNETF